MKNTFEKSMFSRLVNSSARLRMPWIMGLAMIAALGCSEDVALRKYTIEKSVMSEQQMLGAIVPNKETTWFFKLTGPSPEVDVTEEQFRELINSLQFTDSGDPIWQLSSGWKDERTGGITFAKLKTPVPRVSCTVTQLSSPALGNDEAWQDWVLSNVNRWRGQLSLSQQDWAAMQKDLQELQHLNQGESRAYYVSLNGKVSGKMGSGGGPFSGGAFSGGSFSGGSFSGGDAASGTLAETSGGNAARSGPMPPGPPRSPAMQSGGAPKLTYVAPDGWKEGAAGGMRLAAFNVELDGEQAEVTVIAAGGDDRSNVAGWQRQLNPKADEASIDALMQASEKLPVNGVTGELFVLKGTEGPEQPAFFAVIVPWQPSSKLFVKLIGPATLAEKQHEAFKAFVTSMKW